MTETFDAGLLGEHVLSTLQHAWQNLLYDNTKASEPKVRNLVVEANMQLTVTEINNESYSVSR